MSEKISIVLLLVSSYLISVGYQPSVPTNHGSSLKRHSPASEIGNVQIDELHEWPNNFVFAINRDISDNGRGAYWGTLDEVGWIRFYESGPRVSLFQVNFIAISDDDRYLVVETTGELHPILDVFELHNWMYYAPRGMDRDSPPVEPITSLDPYSFSLKSLAWRDDHFVIRFMGA